MVKRCFLLMVMLLALSTTAVADNRPLIYILATGGTIAGSGESSVGSSYKAGQQAISQLIAAVPQMEQIADVRGEQVARIGSQDMTDEIMLVIAKRVNELLATDSVAGVVITHGTDTMEESAYLLTLTTKSDKPVVLVGSMRASTAISADGDRNLYNSVVVASSLLSQGRGVLVAMNDKVYDAKGVTKTHTMAVDTFDSPNSGEIGYVNNGKVVYTQNAEYQHTVSSPFDIATIAKLPRVAILYGHSSVDRVLVDALVEEKYDGIVYAGVGNGNIHSNIIGALSVAAKSGIAVVRSSRVPTGAVTDDAEIDDQEYGFIASQLLNPQKSRILLMLCLSAGFDVEEIREQFKR